MVGSPSRPLSPGIARQACLRQCSRAPPKAFWRVEGSEIQIYLNSPYVLDRCNQTRTTSISFVVHKVSGGARALCRKLRDSLLKIFLPLRFPNFTGAKRESRRGAKSCVTAFDSVVSYPFETLLPMPDPRASSSAADVPSSRTRFLFRTVSSIDIVPTSAAF